MYDFNIHLDVIIFSVLFLNFLTDAFSAFHCPDARLDGSTLPLFSSPDYTASFALHGNGDDWGVAIWRRGAAS
jgi:hypothetical protein